jgi:hypothetical protein
MLAHLYADVIEEEGGGGGGKAGAKKKGGSMQTISATHRVSIRSLSQIIFIYKYHFIYIHRNHLTN